MNSISLSIIATISSIFMLELFPGCFSCNNNFSLSHNSLGFSEKKMVFNLDASIHFYYNSFF